MAKQKRKKTRQQKGFTLIELLMVISMMTLLSSIVFSSGAMARRSARDIRRIQDVKAMIQALESYYLDHGYWPYLDQAGTNAAQNYCAGNPGLSKICDNSSISGGYIFSCNSGQPCLCVDTQSRPNTLAWLTPIDGGAYPIDTYLAAGRAPLDPWDEAGCRPGGGSFNTGFKYSYKSKFDSTTGGVTFSLIYTLEEMRNNAIGEPWLGCSSGLCPFGIYGTEDGNIEDRYVDNL